MQEVSNQESGLGWRDKRTATRRTDSACGVEASRPVEDLDESVKVD